MQGVDDIQTPEERELAAKKQALDSLSEELAEAELHLHTLRAQLGAFESQYFAVVGRRFARIDGLRAEIARLRAKREPADLALAQAAEEATAQAEHSAEAFNAHEAEAERLGRFQPSEDCRALYLRAAKEMHPDLASSDEEKDRRHRFMAALNNAYEAGDIEGVRNVLADWKSSPEAITGDGVAAELVRAIRQISKAAAALESLKQELEALRERDIHRLWIEALAHDPDPTVYLNEMASALDEDIRALEEQVETLRGSAAAKIT